MLFYLIELAKELWIDWSNDAVLNDLILVFFVFINNSVSNAA